VPELSRSAADGAGNGTGSAANITAQQAFLDDPDLLGSRRATPPTAIGRRENFDLGTEDMGAHSFSLLQPSRFGV
jgi:hypothetical protein